jgi:hypothetical protein
MTETNPPRDVIHDRHPAFSPTASTPAAHPPRPSPAPTGRTAPPIPAGRGVNSSIDGRTAGILLISHVTPFFRVLTRPTNLARAPVSRWYKFVGRVRFIRRIVVSTRLVRLLDQTPADLASRVASGCRFLLIPNVHHAFSFWITRDCIASGGCSGPSVGRGAAG